MLRALSPFRGRSVALPRGIHTACAIRPHAGRAISDDATAPQPRPVQSAPCSCAIPPKPRCRLLASV